MAKRLLSPRLKLETLEGREVPASLVSGVVVGGVLTLTGDDMANEFVLTDTGAGMLVSQSNANTLIADGAGVGAASQTFMVVNSVKLVLNGGNDFVTSDNSTALILSGAFVADMGEGNNTLNLNVGTGPASIGSLDYKGLGGDDTLNLGGVGFATTVNGKVSVSGGDGANNVTLTKATVKGDLSHTGLEGDDNVFLTTTTVEKNVTVNGGSGAGSALLLLNGATVTGNVTVKGVGNLTVLQTNGALSTINGAIGVTVDGGVNGRAAIQGFAPLTVTNGGLAVKGTNATSFVNTFGPALIVGKDVTVSNHTAIVATDMLTAKGVTVTGVASASITIGGVATLTGAVKATSSTGVASMTFSGASADVMGAVTATGGAAANIAFNRAVTLAGAVTATSSSGSATVSFFGASADVTGAVSATGAAGASVTDGVSGVAHYRSSVTATSSRADSFFRQNNNSTLIVDGTLNVKGFLKAEVSLSGSNEKKLLKDVSATSVIREAKINVFSGKTTVSGNLAAKGYSTDVFLGAGMAGSTVAKNLTVTGGAGDDSLGWADGFNVLGNATLKLGAGAASLEFGGGATATEVQNLSVTTGNAADELTFDNFKVNGTTTLKTAGGQDTVDIDRSTFVGVFSLDTGDADDRLSIAQNDTNTATTFTGKATIKLGAGNDTLELGTPGVDMDKALFAAPSSTIDGGLGFDVYNDVAGQGLVTTNLTLSGF